MLMAQIEEKPDPGMLHGKSFSVGQAALTRSEVLVMDLLAEIARNGGEVTQAAIGKAFGSEHPFSAARVVNRLVAKGYVERIGGPLQKSMWLRIVATGEVTAEPRDKTPHWRFRRENAPSPVIQRIAERSKPLAQRIEAKARSLGKPLTEFLMDCVYVGFHEICSEDD